MRRSKLRTLTIALIVLPAPAACSKDLTELVAVVDSDLTVPSQLAAIDVDVTSDSGGELGHELFTLASVPVSFGVAPGDESQVTITVKAIGPAPSSAGNPLFARVVRTHAIKGKVLRVPIFLSASCLSGGCPAMSDVDPATLETVEPGKELENIPRPDGGVPPDTGITADAAEVDGGEDAGPDGGPDAGFHCMRNSECPPDHLCLDIRAEGSRVCPAGETCSCYRTCDAFSVQPQPCGAGDECFWWQRGAGRGAACVAQGEGGHQNDACIAMFDPSGNKLSDDCDPFGNLFCIFPTPVSPNGSCAHFCDVGLPEDLCTMLGNFECNDVYLEPGLCLNPPPSATDIGTICAQAPDCSTFCSQIVGYCTASCSQDLDVCADGSNCIRLPAPESWNCLKACPNGDSDCPSTDYYCENFSTLPSCIPKCTRPNHVCPTGRTNCDMQTGHCIP